VLHRDIVGDRAKERNTNTDHHRDPGDDNSGDESGGEKLLNGLSSIHVEMLETSSLECGYNVDRIS